MENHSNNNQGNTLVSTLLSGAVNLITNEIQRNNSVPNSNQTENKYTCHSCQTNFSSNEFLHSCSECSSEFIELLEESSEAEPSQRQNTELNLNNIMYLATMANTMFSQFSQSLNQVENNRGEGMRDMISFLTSLGSQNVERQFHDANGQQHNVATNLGALILPFIETFGFNNSHGRNNRNPVPEAEIASITEVKILEEDFEYNEETKEMEPPKCSICIYEIIGPTVKTDCKHYFHKDCLQGWLRIHNE